MGKFENLHGKKQAFLAMKGTVALIPFQIQDPKEKGEDKRLPYLMYLLWKREKLTSFMSRNPKPP
jgi:hypothetical protein